MSVVALADVRNQHTSVWRVSYNIHVILIGPRIDQRCSIEMPCAHCPRTFFHRWWTSDLRLLVLVFLRHSKPKAVWGYFLVLVTSPRNCDSKKGTELRLDYSNYNLLRWRIRSKYIFLSSWKGYEKHILTACCCNCTPARWCPWNNRSQRRPKRPMFRGRARHLPTGSHCANCLASFHACAGPS